MKILGIESSCDDTAAAVITSDKEILSSAVWSQLKEHAAFGGVVPEIAARSHVAVMDEVIEVALKEADTTLDEIDLISVTGGPGLIGGVMVGAMTAKALALASGKPLVAVNHLTGHALTVRLTEEVEYPYLLLLISGGHCQWLAVEGVDRFRLLGATLDDALGEAFDKTAKMLGLGYPGGPAVEILAEKGDAYRFDLPVPLKGKPNCNFSFSGLKTAVREVILKAPPFSEQDKADLCASFQRVVSECIADRLKRAIKLYDDAPRLVVAGGVAANKALRASIEAVAAEHGYSLHVPPIHLCTDNAAMIAWAGYEHYCVHGATALGFEPRARWPLVDKA
ncbi:MAG: tRNA (adenosine(37)-N6)-threonylcarbamoyltransferase complex transferase subunit TsaD [Rickettsiales bacterium]|nr:tRNA (adenosine(37)-N6)-threonylcarbamoyltransferase complex transferase subunit TsaD [Rickettsiales bacterium]